MAIVNLEVKKMFGYMVRRWFNYANGDYKDFVKAMFAGNIEDMNAYLKRVVSRILGFFSMEMKKDQLEAFYYSLILALMVGLGNQYEFTIFYECDIGRCDIILESKNSSKRAFILEFKNYEMKEERGLNDTVQVALAQIEMKQYENSLIEKGIPAECIRKYGFAFGEKKVLIG